MQDKDLDSSRTADDADEALSRRKAEPDSDRRDSKKDAKFAFRKMKQPKKEKSEKSGTNRFQGEGVVFKAKLIGVEAVSDARGDKMCQDAMHKLKLNVKNLAPHKRKINVCVSLQGIKIKDEKNGNIIYHHPVSVISFISQDITDARAFGYVFGSSGEPHQFLAIKTDKPAFHVVVAIRDLFQTVLNFKQEEIESAKEGKGNTKDTPQAVEKSETDETNKVIAEQKAKEENIYFEVLLQEPLKIKEEEPSPEPQTTVDDLLGLESDISKLREGITQMDTSIAAAVAFNSDVTVPESDPFDTSFVLGPKRDSIPLPMPTPIPMTTMPAGESQHQPPNNSHNNPFSSEDKYAVFSVVDATPSIFEATASSETPEPEDDHEAMREELRKTPPSKPPRSGCNKTPQPDLSLFADLDPLGKDRPYKDKAEFFQDVKNPPKKVLNDLVDPTRNSDAHPSSVSFPVDFESTLPLSSSLPDSQHHAENDDQHSPMNSSSSPIPIPARLDSRSLSVGSPYSKSPYGGESPVQADFYLQGSDAAYSPVGLKSLLQQGGGVPALSPPANVPSRHSSTTQNGTSRPRPRPSLSKGSSVASSVGHSHSSHSLSSDSSSDYEAISRESMQSIANVLLSGGHRLRAQSLTVEANNEYNLKGEGKTIFARKNDPFADDFFFSIPKKVAAGHLGGTEIPECV